MKNSLAELKQKICDLSTLDKISNKEWDFFKNNSVVALMAGGESSRFKSVPGSENSNKNSFKLPNGDTMIEMTIRMYRDSGIKNFVALVYHKAETIEELLGDGSNLGVSITYSYDPQMPVGKGGAVLNALENKSIKKNKILIVHNPDDVILDPYKKEFSKQLARGYFTAKKINAVASVVIVEETPYSFSGMKVTKNLVKQIEMYPMIPIPTHIGVTIFDPDAYDYFYKYFNLKEKSDFEKVLFPILAQENRLSAVSIPTDSWLAVNNLKAYNHLLKTMETTKTNTTPKGG